MAFFSLNVITKRATQKYRYLGLQLYILFMCSQWLLSQRHCWRHGSPTVCCCYCFSKQSHPQPCSWSLLGSTDAYINLLFSLRVPGAAALVRREESSAAQKRENSSSSSASSPREEEIMMEPIPRVEEEASEVISESIF